MNGRVRFYEGRTAQLYDCQDSVLKGVDGRWYVVDCGSVRVVIMRSTDESDSGRRNAKKTRTAGK